MNSKEYFFDQVIKEAASASAGPVRILELGCGTARYVPAMIEKYPQLEYVGVEPIEASYNKAVEILKDVPRTKVHLQLGYDAVTDLADASFDIVISFSVLEHVKQLDKFMALSARYAKQGGLVVHRYDLGHALYPWSLKERVHAWIGNTVPSILPERQFVRYVPLKEVDGYYRDLLGNEPYRHTYHQMRNHKRLTKVLPESDAHVALMEDVFAWEFKYADTFHTIPLKDREYLFPTIAMWGRKV